MKTLYILQIYTRSSYSFSEMSALPGSTTKVYQGQSDTSGYCHIIHISVHFYSVYIKIQYCIFLRPQQELSNVRIFLSHLEGQLKNVLGVGWSTQDGHTNNILSEVYGAISVLDRVKETVMKISESVNADYYDGQYFSLCVLEIYTFVWHQQF